MDVMPKHSRRSLFSNNGLMESFNDNTDGLGPISPISYDSNSNDEEEKNHEDSSIILTPKNKISPPSESSMSPLFLSPFGFKDNVNIKNTPLKGYKTPNELTSTDKVPKLSKKTQHDSFVPGSGRNVEILYANSSPEKDIPKNSKVRTTLFPDLNLSLPTNLFYSKSTVAAESVKIKMNQSFDDFNKKRKSSGSKKSRRNAFGKSGVGHSIKRPNKKKSIPKVILNVNAQPVKYNLKNDDILEPELKEYLNELNEIKSQVKQIQNVNIRKPEEIIKKSVKQSEIKEISKTVTESGSIFDGLDDDAGLEGIKEIDTILNTLYDDEKENVESNQQVKTVAKSSPFEILSPTTQMCHMASDLVICSPKSSRQINFSNTEEKLYPLFYQENFPKGGTKRGNNSPLPVQEKKRFKAIPKNQTFIDAGQKHWGIVECEECNTVYHAGDPNDEVFHEKQHNGTDILRFKGWKNENILYQAGPTRIISILPTDSKIWIEKIKQVFQYISRSMGYFDEVSNLQFDMVLLFINGTKISGALFAESKSTGYKILTSNADLEECSEKEYPIKCGVFRLWVDPKYRRKGLAKILMNCLKQKFLPGIQLRNEDVAFTTPTAEGKLFAASYFNTPYYFTYFG